METPKTNGATARLPEGVPDGVQLLDESWLSTQKAGGARLTLLEPLELNRLDGAANELRAELDRARAARGSTQAQHDRLKSERDQAQTDLAGLEARFAAQQSANSALLATVHELEKRASGREKTIRAIACQLGSVQAEVGELHRALDFAERPLWRKLLRRA